MEPIVLFPNPATLSSGEMEFDCNCACALADLGPLPEASPLSGDVVLRTCRPIYEQSLMAEYDLILSPASRTTLAVVNAPARQVLDFFSQGGTIAELLDDSALAECVCQEAVRALWQAGFLVSADCDEL